MNVMLGSPFFGDDPIRLRNLKETVSAVMGMHDFKWWSTAGYIDRDNRGLARNNIVAHALRLKADVVVICDADCIPEPGGLGAAMYAAYTHGGLHFAFDKFRGLTEQGTTQYRRGLPLLQAGDIDYECPGSLGGVMAIRPADWVAAGWSPELEGWGFEDVIFAVQARTLLGRPNTWHPGWVTHQWHPTLWRMGDPDYVRNIGICKQFEAVDQNPDGIEQLIRSGIGNHPERCEV